MDIHFEANNINSGNTAIIIIIIINYKYKNV